jgi:hypothetical protein
LAAEVTTILKRTFFIPGIPARSGADPLAIAHGLDCANRGRSWNLSHLRTQVLLVDNFERD